MFSYLGVEIIGLAAEETERQRETLPRVVRRVAYRSIIYHVGAIFVLGINVSGDDLILKRLATEEYGDSPFVLMVMRAGIGGLRHWIRAVTILALVSVANTRLYVSVCPRLCPLISESSPVCTVSGTASSSNLPKEGIVECSDIQCSDFSCSCTFGIPFNQNHIKDCTPLCRRC